MICKLPSLPWNWEGWGICWNSHFRLFPSWINNEIIWLPWNYQFAASCVHKVHSGRSSAKINTQRQLKDDSIVARLKNHLLLSRLWGCCTWNTWVRFLQIWIWKMVFAGTVEPCPSGSSIHQHRWRAQWSCGERRQAQCHALKSLYIGIAELELMGCVRWVEFSCGWRAWVCSQVLARGIAICSLSSHWLCHTSVSFHCFPRSQFVGATGKSTSFHRWLQVASKSLNQELGKCFDGIEQRASTSDDERCGKRWKEVECSGWQSSSTIYQGRRTWMSTIGLFIVQLNYTAFACAVHVLPLYAIHMSQWQVNYVNLICATTILGWTEHVCTLAKSKFWASIISKLRCTPMFFLFLLISMLKESRKTHWGNFADWYFAYPTSLKLLRAAVTWIWNQIEVDGDTISWLCLLIQPVGMRVT